MNKPFKFVKMYGPCLKGSGKTVNADVAEGNVRAFKAAGYQMGSVEVDPVEAEMEAVAEVVNAVIAGKKKGKK